MKDTEMNRRELVRRATELAGLTGLALAAPALLAERAASAAAPPDAGTEMGQPSMPSMPNMPKMAMPKHDMSGYGIPTGPPQQIAMLVYPQMTALDLIGPLQMLNSMGNVEIHLVWKDKSKPIVSDAGVPIVPTTTFAECPDDLTILFAPGGSRGTLAVMNDAATLDFMARKGKTAKWVTSTCTGSLVLGAAGLLKGHKATSHWAFRDQMLPLLGATPVKARVVEDRNRMTGAGVTAGMDLALHLIAKLRNEKMGRAVQLGMEYDPQPPFHAGSPETAGADVVSMFHAAYFPIQQEMKEAAERARKRNA